MRCEGSSAVVTGGASGLGLATARRLLEAGMKICIFDLESSNGVEVAELLGPDCLFVAGDVRSPDDVRRAIDAATGLAPLRAAINCAGVATPGKLVGRRGPLDLEAFRRVVDINLTGTVNVSALAAAAMRESSPLDGERGVIVNTASIAAFEGQIGQIAYAASKAGVVGLTLPAARELAGDLIRVVAIAPGLFETPMMAGFAESVRTALAAQPLHPRRLGLADEYADLVAHVLSNPYLNGTVLRLDGAIRLQPE